MPDIPSFEEFVQTEYQPQQDSIPSFQDFVKNEYDQPSFGDKFANATQAFLRGVTRMPGAGVAGLGDVVEALNHLSPMSRGGAPDMGAKVLQDAGLAMENFAKETFPGNPKLQDNFLATVVPEAFGSTAGFAAGGYVSAFAKIPGLLGAALLGSAVGAHDQAQDARQKGATEDQVDASTLLGAAIGTTEAIPFMSVFNRLNKATGGRLVTAFKEAGTVGVEELLQETFQQTSGNLVAKEIYDEHRPLFEGVAEAGGAGGISGAIIGFLSGALRQRGVSSSPKPEPSIREQLGLPPETPPVPPTGPTGGAIGPQFPERLGPPDAEGPRFNPPGEIGPPAPEIEGPQLPPGPRTPPDFVEPAAPLPPRQPGGIMDIAAEQRGAVLEIRDISHRMDQIAKQGLVVPNFLYEDMNKAVEILKNSKNVTIPCE